MRGAGIALAAALAVTACGGGEVGQDEAPTAVAPDNPKARINVPAKCRDALTFDQECVDLFDKAYGPGAGSNERARLNTERAYSGGNAYKRSDAKPAPKIGEKN